ncbi:adenosine deaminase-like protein [Danaus plexippus]|uniref:adenosine deaminase-like protein n=1 Tax=Danaus plexippus TaxID=13037 RepID=UPI0013C525CC|nr:adenosine deaminase-like protein [Danaus plexippus]
MELNTFCRELPKIELHAHLNGSLSRSTMLQLQRYLADSGVSDRSNAFLDEFQIGSGDKRNLSDCFQVFNIAHSLTSTQDTLAMATALTLKEFEDDGCCYIELRSTPRDTPHMTSRQYIETLIETLNTANTNLSIISCLIISINRSRSQSEGDGIADLAIEYHKKYPNLVVGIELSGNPTVGKFQDFVPALQRAREAGLKITLHCGEVSNPEEVFDMLMFKAERIGHGICIHPNYGGNESTWNLICNYQIPVEVCLTSNINTKSILQYSSHHFKELYSANIPIILCTDDKGVFATSLSQEYSICAETFGLDASKLARLSLRACDYIFMTDKRKILREKILNFINKNEL